MSRAEQWTDVHGERLSRHQYEVRGRIRYDITRQNLVDTLGDFLHSPVTAIDVGGGEGLDARWLDGLDSRIKVSLAEPNKAAFAKVLKAHQSNPFLDKIINGDAEKVLEEIGPGQFDLVLSHAVLPYIDNPQSEVDRLGDLLRPGGYLSLSTTGTYGKLNQFKKEGDITATERLLLTGLYLNRLRATARAYYPHDIERVLQRAGLKVINWFGVRVLPDTDEDSRQWDKVPALERNRIFGRELNASRNPVQRPNG